VYDLSTLNRVKEHEAIAISFANTGRDSSNTLQFVYFVETLSGEDCFGRARVAHIKTANEAILRLRHTHYPMNVSPKDELAIKILDICLVCKKKIIGGGIRKPGTTIIYAMKFHQGEVTFGGLRIHCVI
jgi:hypothetical protein